MSERTPQDVLRELRAAVEALRPGPDVTVSFSDVWDDVLDEVLPLIDKAIAEGSDSPPEWPTREEVRQARLDLKEGRAKPLRVPDAPSEKPGLDVERLRLAMEAAWPSHTEGSGGTGRSIQASWRVTDPALPSTYLANRVSREYDRLGSTDSEGR